MSSTMAKTCFNSRCSLIVGGPCLCRVVACTPCHCAVSIGSLHPKHNDILHPTGNDGLAFPDVNVHPPDTVNVSENDESADEPVSENLDSCTERSFLSQRQCRLIYQQLRNSDLCLAENFSALMHGNNSDCRVCVLEVCAARDSPVTNTVSRKMDLS